MIHPRSGRSGLGLSQAEARSFIWVSHVSTRTQGLGPSYAFPDTLMRSWIGSGVEKLGLELVPVWDTGTAGGGLSHYTIALAPHTYF